MYTQHQQFVKNMSLNIFLFSKLQLKVFYQCESFITSLIIIKIILFTIILFVL